MNISVVLSTYNSPAWLEKVLWGYHYQRFRDFEIVVADDGSDERTRALIDQMRESTRLQIRHVWQHDDGFRKCRILNKAILETREEYIVFSDGDCIPRSDFLEVHAKRAEPGYYLSGSYFKLPMETSKVISQEHIASGVCFQVPWLRQHGLGLWRKTWKINAGPRRARVMNRITTTRCNFKGSNASAWKSDILAVNGFDERMGWGGEDREFGVRLLNYGVNSRHVRYDAIVIHLDHARGYVDREEVERNRRLRIANTDGTCWTDYGISRSGDSN
ncbi:MAG: glycosyltransferase family 2 protein [Pseudomonadales bacterium]